MVSITETGTGHRPGFGRLRFTDELEAHYADDFFPQALPRARFAIVLAIVLYAVFGVLDAFVVPAQAPWMWFIRYAVVCPLGLVVLAVTFTRWFRPFMQVILSVFAAVGGLGIVAMVGIAHPSGGHLYYAGLVLVIFWIYTLLQLRFWYATGACLVMIAGYEIVAVWIQPMPIEILISNNFFFLSAAVLGVVAGYTIERGNRAAFAQRQLIEAQRADLADHNVELNSALRASLQQVRRQADELRASRARIVVAGDVERRRIERNLHDGAQQQLLALAVKLTVAEKLVGRDDEQRLVLAQLKSDAQEALETLRDLARGIYPSLLANHGLAVALDTQARKAPLPVRVMADAIGRYGSEVEAAVYFSTLEALQNVAKYANASAATVVLSESDGMVLFEVTDDGVGFDPTTTSHGIGLQSMADRLEALGGSLILRSEPGHGTTVSGAVPHGSI